MTLLQLHFAWSPITALTLDFSQVPFLGSGVKHFSLDFFSFFFFLFSFYFLFCLLLLLLLLLRLLPPLSSLQHSKHLAEQARSLTIPIRRDGETHTHTVESASRAWALWFFEWRCGQAAVDSHFLHTKNSQNTQAVAGIVLMCTAKLS